MCWNLTLSLFSSVGSPIATGTNSPLFLLPGEAIIFPDGLKIPDDMLEVVTEHPSSGNCPGASQFHVREALSIRSGSLPLPIRVNPAVFCYAEAPRAECMRRRLVASIGKDVSISVIHGQPFDFVRRQTGRVAM